LNRIKKCLHRCPTDDKAGPQETFIHKFSLNDFQIAPTCPEDCLDLYGICRKM
jgi:hypothetical protein